MRELLGFLQLILHTYYWVVIIAVVLSWLLAFNVVNYSNQVVRTIWQAVSALTEPFLRPIRRVLPNMGGIDLPPIVLLLIVIGIADFFIPYLARTFT